VGKSTLAGLIAGTLTPCAGEVWLGRVPLQRLGPAALTRHRMIIPQEAYVFAGTLGENLAYLNPQASPAELEEAARTIGLHALAKRLGGYDSQMEPASLSAGERQLIALARVYLSPARIVVLDEATCHLDPAAEIRAERAFTGRPGTLIVIAHRMSSALRARRVLVLDGDHADIGTHDSLLRRSALYRDLVGYWKVRDAAASDAATQDAGVSGAALVRTPGSSGDQSEPAGQSQPAWSAMRMASTRLRAPVFPMTRDR
jgi:ATP-binding cassette subfamily C protein